MSEPVRMKTLRKGIIDASRTRQLTGEERAAWDAVKKTGTQDEALVEAALEAQEQKDREEGRPHGFSSEVSEV